MEERNNMINYLVENHGFERMALDGYTNDQLLEKYNTFTADNDVVVEDIEVVEKEEVIEEKQEESNGEAIVKLVNDIIEVTETLVSGEYPEWIDTIPDADIRQVAIDKYSVTADDILSLAIALKSYYGG